MGKLFGTDGVRGIAISELTTEAAMLIGRAAAVTLAKNSRHKAKILIGKDTRVSCDVLESALIAGICSVGADVHTIGILPTPALAYLTVKYGADAGIMITASHNSFEFNGIKIFSSSGYRLPNDVEEEIERLVFEAQDEMQPVGNDNLGKVVFEKNAEWDYVRYLLRKVSADLARYRVVIDCANGAAYSCAEKFFNGIGASVIMINNKPNGININLDCGSNDPKSLCKAVIDNHANIGLAFDGDGGRCVVVDEKGRVIDGDNIIALLALSMKEEGKLRSNTCVVNQMTNLGFFKWAKENGIVVSTVPKIGSGYVLERMISDNYNLGGEQSGHIVFGDLETTGDGELTGAKILEILKKSGKKMSELGSVFTPYPQILLNVKIRQEYRGMWKQIPEILKIIDFCSDKLGDDGRILVRESGTEPVIRIMAEGRSGEDIRHYAETIALAVKNRLGDYE